MRRTLTLLLGIWVFTAPAVCGAICIDGPTPADPRVVIGDVSTVGERPMDSCHEMAGGDRNQTDSNGHSAPTSDDDCCAEGNSSSFQIKAPKTPPSPVTHVIGAATNLASFQPQKVSASFRTEIRRVRSPYLRSNPPLLI